MQTVVLHNVLAKPKVAEGHPKQKTVFNLNTDFKSRLKKHIFT